MNMTMTTNLYSSKDIREARLPPVRPSNLRKTSTKLTKNK